MDKLSIILLALAVTFLLGACASPAGSATGSKVNTAGGSYTNIGPTQLKQMLTSKDFVFVNVHIPYEGELAPTDVFVPYNEIERNLAKLPADKQSKIVLYCRSGQMSGIAAETLVRLGYTNIWNLEGGMIAWENAGLPLVRK